MGKPNALYILGQRAYNIIYGPEERADIAELTHVLAEPLQREAAIHRGDLLEQVEVIFSGWGGPTFNEDFLAKAPNFKACFYGAGSIRNLVTPAFWQRDAVICSAWAANALPVAEYTLSQVLWNLKKGWYYARKLRETKQWRRDVIVPGAYGTTVGIISLGMIGRRVVELLQPFDLKVIAYDPFVAETDARAMGVDELVSLEDLFRRSHVASLHTPNLPETRGLITGKLLESLPENATFINTARGAVVCEEEMIDVLKKRTDLHAVLDVVNPEPPEETSPLWTLENVTLTPHIAGSMDTECNRMGRFMVEDCKRWMNGEPMKWQIREDQAKRLA